METPDYILMIILAGVNMLFGAGGAVLLAGWLGRIIELPKTRFRYFILCVGLYFMECVAFAAGMATQIFSIALAFIWGFTLGFWLRGKAPTSELLKSSFLISLYSCLPTCSVLLVVPLLMSIYGYSVLSAEQGLRFGIPDFLNLPWPLNTILGFFAAITLVTVIFKVVITTGEVSLLIHAKEKNQI